MNKIILLLGLIVVLLVVLIALYTINTPDLVDTIRRLHGG